MLRVTQRGPYWKSQTSGAVCEQGFTETFKAISKVLHELFFLLFLVSEGQTHMHMCTDLNEDLPSSITYKNYYDQTQVVTVLVQKNKDPNIWSHVLSLFSFLH